MTDTKYTMWYYSWDDHCNSWGNHDWHGPFSTRDIAIGEARAHHGSQTFYVRGCYKANPQDLTIDAVFTLCTLYRDYASMTDDEGYEPPDLTNAQDEELSDRLTAVFRDWAARHAIDPNIVIVGSVEQIEGPLPAHSVHRVIGS